MTKYLIMKCEELGDQYECDANREPICLVDDWEDWYKKNFPTYRFEVYKFVDDEEAELVKRYEDYIDEGMALYFWNIEDNYEEVEPTVVGQYPNFDRNSPVPKKVWKIFRQGAYWADEEVYTEKEFKNDLASGGYAAWCDEARKKWWVYGPYADGRYAAGC